MNLDETFKEQDQINSDINLMENVLMGKAEEPVNLDEMFEEQDSVDLVENLFTLNEEEGRAAAIIYFKKYKDASLGEILGQVGHWQNK
eukprot:5085462-Ditylum_brightwellii.AAC.2